MIGSVLVVCVGNICRSPVAERLLQAEFDRHGAAIRVTSAGLHAVVGAPADADAGHVAQAHGLSLAGHVARQFTDEIARQSDLILVMEPAHKAEIGTRYSAASGKTFLFDQWAGGKGIADPYRRSREYHEAVFALIRDAARPWAARLLSTRRR